MDAKSIRVFELQRFLVGETPWGFLLEALLRATLLYFLLVVSMRVLGKRMAATTTRNELAALVALAGAIGPAMMTPDRGLIPVLVVAVVIVCTARLIAAGSFRNPSFEHVSQGDVTILAQDGELAPDALRTVTLSRERIFSQLRSKQVENLGRVQRFYMESNGSFSLVQYAEPRAGLSIVPDWDHEFGSAQPKADGVLACAHCGHVIQRGASESQPCARCHERRWKDAVIT
jgi:uncharacterized membrane protein YcaP (DUF421 family)